MGASRLLLCSIFQLLHLGASGAPCESSVGDETCFLQTEAKRIDSKTRGHPYKAEEEFTADSSQAEVVEEVQEHQGLLSRTDSRAVPHFEINLDLDPKDRFMEVAHKFRKQYTTLLDKGISNWNKVVGYPDGMTVAEEVSHMRGPENDEMMGEIRGIAKHSGVPEAVIHSAQLAPQLEALRGPALSYFHNMGMSLDTVTKSMAFAMGQELPEKTTELLSEFSAPSYGCTGIIARDDSDGSVWHARNLGSPMNKHMQKLTYNAKFTKGGKELYTAQMVFPLVQPLTAIRRGSDGYSYALNARYADKVQDAKDVIANLFSGKVLTSGWYARKILEGVPTYDAAVQGFATAPIPGPEYHIISGVKKGVILARNADSLAYKLDLNDHLKKHKYIIMTNFDSINGDEKEWYEVGPKKERGADRRIRAQKMLDDGMGKQGATAELLKNVLSDDLVSTHNAMFQAMINVEHDTFDTALPHFAKEGSRGGPGDGGSGR